MTAHDPSTRFWNKTARKYAASAIGDPAGFERTLERVRMLVPAGSAMFEFGCGTGTAALKLAPHAGHILATDISEEMITIAREKAAAESVSNVSFEVGTAEDPRWGESRFDAALGFNILHLVPNRPAALAGIHRLLKPGGLFLSKSVSLAEMNPVIRLAVPLMRALGQAPYVATVTEATLVSEIEATGFQIESRERHAMKGKDVRPVIIARKV
ncbi:class I SAM-dependent methyltransferase [Hyphomonas sp.]|uniref:class I SAM-dependent methyltransferase n=1 Tax=Hyphomonas sp. TaxID=87 RepID=UPI00391DFB59